MAASKLEVDQQITFAFELKVASVFVFMPIIDAVFIFNSMVVVNLLIFMLIAISFIFDSSSLACFLVLSPPYLAHFYCPFHSDAQ